MRNSIAKLILPALVVAGGLIIATRMSYAKPEYTKTTKKSCIYCHVTAGKKDLNDIGKCYAEHDHSLEACAPKK
jgi:hypothetical protein